MLFLTGSTTFFMANSKSHDQLKQTLPEGVTIVGSLSELLGWMKKAIAATTNPSNGE